MGHGTPVQIAIPIHPIMHSSHVCYVMSITRQVWIMSMTRWVAIPTTVRNVYVVTRAEMQNKDEL